MIKEDKRKMKATLNFKMNADQDGKCSLKAEIRDNGSTDQGISKTSTIYVCHSWTDGL